MRWCDFDGPVGPCQMARSLEWARDIRLSRGVERPITPGHPVEGRLCPTLPLKFARVTDVLQTRLSFLRWTSTIASGAPPLAVCLVSETKVRQTTYMMWTRWSPVREDHLSRCHADYAHSTFLTTVPLSGFIRLSTSSPCGSQKRSIRQHRQTTRTRAGSWKVGEWEGHRLGEPEAAQSASGP